MKKNFLTRDRRRAARAPGRGKKKSAGSEKEGASRIIIKS